MYKKIFVGLIVLVGIAACSKTEVAKPLVKKSWWDKTKCKIINDNNKCVD
jgi:hypothetical protein